MILCTSWLFVVANGHISIYNHPDMADKEVEDHNAFNRWDCVGAAALLAFFPALVCIFYKDFDTNGAIFWGGVSVAVAGVVFILSLILNDKFLGRLINLVGWIITIAYGCWAYDLVMSDFERLTSDPAQEKKAPEAPKN